MAAAYIPNPWKCETAFEIEASLGHDLIKFIDAKKLTPTEINRRYPSVRLGHLEKLRNGEHLNFRMLTAIIEATGAPFAVRGNQ